MKKLIALVLVLVCVLALVGCNHQKEITQQGDNQDIHQKEELQQGDNQDILEPESYAFEAQYIRTDGYSDDRSYPYCVVIDSKEELEAYYDANKEQFDLERKETVYTDTTIGFLDACDKYDDTYFDSNNLILIILQESSGSVRHEITDVRAQRDEKGTALGWNISINSIVPEVVTDDMAQWHLLLEVQMGNVINDQDSIFINGRLCESKGNK